MGQSIAVPLAAFAILLATVATGLTTQGWTAWQAVTHAPAKLMRGIATGLLALAALALGMLTLNTRADFLRAEAHVRMLAQDIGLLDEALRAAGEAGDPARITLFRYSDTLCGLLDGGHSGHGHELDLETLRAELRRDVMALPFGTADAQATAVARLEIALRAEAATWAIAPLPGVRWCRPILVAWMAVGLGLLAVIAPAGWRSAALLTLLAGSLSAGLFLLEEMASPFKGSIVIEHSIMDDMLHTLAQ